MSNRDGKGADTKKRDKYKIGKVCPKCGKGILEHCDLYKADNKHKDCLQCKTCKTCNY